MRKQRIIIGLLTILAILMVPSYGTAAPAPLWTIDKSANPTILNLFRGDSGTVTYIIDVVDDEGETIDVTDSNVGSFQFGGSGSVIYEKTFTCDADAGTHVNTVTGTDSTGFSQSIDASVTVNCYDLQVSKTASTSSIRTYSWNIYKSVDQSSLTLSTGQQFLVNYSVVASLAGYTDSEWAVSGNITVYNPAPIAATLEGVSDIVSPDIAATVDCGVTFPYLLAPGGTLICTYSAALPDDSSRTNTATATLENTPGGTTDFSGSNSVDFGSATITEVDECIDASDSYAGNLGTVCYQSAPVTFNYSRTIGPYDVCGDYTTDNTASFVTNDTGTTGSHSVTVAVSVPCVGGCTLTPGYWKTHTEFGPAPYDDNWAQLLPDGANTVFFLSGQTYYQALWTPPLGGNAYYILAQQYIATELNFLNGADPAAAQAAFDEATVLFQTYTPAEVAAARGKNGKALRDQFIELAKILDEYNNGLTGPGHCSEEVPSVVINEIDYDQPGTDAAEFIELKNNGSTAVDLTGWTLELVNGSGGGAAIYLTFDLSGHTLAAGGYFVICGNAANVANCDLDVSPDTNLIQNGSPDAVALRYNGVLMDTVSYEGDTSAPYTEGSGTGLVDDPSGTGSISRCPDGVDTDQNNVDFSFTGTITPGAANACLPPG
jgi:hypothetical protein